MVSKINLSNKLVYIIIAAGPGDWAASEDKKTFYEIITFEVKGMEMGMITPGIIEKQLLMFGKIANYSIYFDTGKSLIKPE